MKNRREKLFAVVPPGVEGICASELKEIGLDAVTAVQGGVCFEGGLRELYQANLWSRTASRIVVRIGEFKSRDFPDFYKKAVRLPWGRFVRPQTRINVRATSHASRLSHTGRIAETLEKAIAHALGASSLSENTPEQLVLVRIEDNQCVFSIDSSGELLHRRGYRVRTGHAPLRENLAAAILRAAGWNGTAPLFDPMCGSGTFLIEGALIAMNAAPGRHRTFAFMNWPGYRQGLWQALCRGAAKEQRSVQVPLSGADRDAVALQAARSNAEKAGVLEYMEFVQRELTDTPPIRARGLLVCNPPYGERLGVKRQVPELFALLGKTVHRAFPGWEVALLCPQERFARATGLPLAPCLSFANGGIPVSLYVNRTRK